jgi:arylamine N-acetyltransferase
LFSFVCLEEFTEQLCSSRWMSSDPDDVGSKYLSETLTDFYQTTRRYNPEDRHLHTRRRENLKSNFAADSENVHQILEDQHPPRIFLPLGILLFYSV